MNIERYLEQREALIQAAVPGTASARQLARLTDEALRSMAEEAASSHLPQRVCWSLLALGGYGAGALLPGSDLDLLVVSKASPATIKPFIEALLYPLWDAGLKVGHQVRSRKEQLHAVREDTSTLTAAFTGRTIAGDETLARDVLQACAVDAHKRFKAVLAALRDRERPGSPYLLEPDLKEGAGGRRDFDELTWTAAVLTGIPQSDPSALVSSGLLSAEENERLSQAADTVAAARWKMQRAGFGSLMTEDATGEVADPDTVQVALAETHHIMRCVRDRLAGQNCSDNTSISATDLLSALDAGTTSLPEIEDAAWAGRLDPLIPGFRNLMVLRRPGLAHTLTVGAHCLKTAALVGEIVRGEIADELTHRSAVGIGDMQTVQVAALIHDVGKEIEGAGHAERSATTAEPIASLFGLEKSAPHIASLIRYHLLLAEVASSRDLEDEDAILATAAVLEDRDLVAPLHILTVADSLATGPSAWTEWHAALVGRLVTHLDAALADDISGAGIATAAEGTRSEALAVAGLDDPRAEFLHNAHIRYLAGRSVDEVVRHAALVAEVAGDSRPGAHTVDISVGPLPHSFRVTVVTADRPGLLAKMTGVMALCSLDILGVEAASASSGIALDTFTVRSATLAEIELDTWNRLDRYLNLTLRDRFAAGVRLAERSQHYRSSAKTPITDARIDTTDPYATVLTIRTPDRVGLLHDIARAIEESGLDIASLTALTRSGMAEDTFRLVNATGAAPKDEGALGQLMMRLRDLGWHMKH